MKRSLTYGLVTSLLVNMFSSLIPAQQVHAAISCGELVDKITILQIKSERINDAEKLKNITTELELLLDIFHHSIGNRTDVQQLMHELKKTNEALWDIDYLIRIKERIKDFGDEFITLARSVYITNDQRCTLKRTIDTILGSPFMEEKSYASLTY